MVAPVVVRSGADGWVGMRSLSREYRAGWTGRVGICAKGAVTWSERIRLSIATDGSWMHATRAVVVCSCEQAET